MARGPTAAIVRWHPMAGNFARLLATRVSSALRAAGWTQCRLLPRQCTARAGQRRARRARRRVYQAMTRFANRQHGGAHWATVPRPRSSATSFSLPPTACAASRSRAPGLRVPSLRCRRDDPASAPRRDAPRAAMPPPGNAEEAAALRWCDGGVGGRPPLRAPLRAGAWRPGMPTHWTEESADARARHLALRAVSLLQLVAGVAYLQYRARRTIGVFDTSPQLLCV